MSDAERYPSLYWAYDISGFIIFAVTAPFVVYYCFKTIQNNLSTRNVKTGQPDTVCTYVSSMIGIIFFTLSCICYLINSGVWVVLYLADPVDDETISKRLNVWDIWNIVCFGLYAIAIWIMLFTFLLRIKKAFAHQSACMIKALFVHVILIAVFMLLIIILLLVGINPGFFGVVCVVLMVGYVLALLLLLCKQMLLMVEERGRGQMNKNTAEVVDIDTFDTATKYASLIILGNLSTFLCCSLLAMNATVPGFVSPAGVFIALDIFANATALFLMFNFSHGSYSKYCNKYHVCFQDACIACAYRGRIKDERTKEEFASLVLAQMTDEFHVVA